MHSWFERDDQTSITIHHDNASHRLDWLKVSVFLYAKLEGRFYANLVVHMVLCPSETNAVL